MESTTDTHRTHRPDWTFRSDYTRSDRDRRMSRVAKVACHVEAHAYYTITKNHKIDHTCIIF